MRKQTGYILSAYAMFGFTKTGGINIPSYALALENLGLILREAVIRCVLSLSYADR